MGTTHRHPTHQCRGPRDIVRSGTQLAFFSQELLGAEPWISREGTRSTDAFQHRVPAAVPIIRRSTAHTAFQTPAPTSRVHVLLARAADTVGDGLSQRALPYDASFVPAHRRHPSPIAVPFNWHARARQGGGSAGRRCLENDARAAATRVDKRKRGYFTPDFWGVTLPQAVSRRE